MQRTQPCPPPAAVLAVDSTVPDAPVDVWTRDDAGRYVSSALGIALTLDELQEDGWQVTAPLVALPAPTDVQRRRVAAGITDPDPRRVERAATLLAALEAVGLAFGVDPEDWRRTVSLSIACWDVTAQGGAR